MRLEEVLPAIRAGQKVRRQSWANKDFTVASSYYAVYSGADLIAGDWYVVEEHKLCPWCAANGKPDSCPSPYSTTGVLHWIKCSNPKCGAELSVPSDNLSAAWESWDRRTP